MTSTPRSSPSFSVFSGLSANSRGIGMVFASTIGRGAVQGMVRHTVSELHPFEVAFFRNFFGLISLLPWFLRHGLGPLRTKRLGLHLLRASISVFAVLATFYAISITPLALVAALSFTAPIFATVLVAVILGERAGVRRWLAILFGFFGALVILRPGFATLQPGALLVLGASVITGFSVLLIKVLGRTESSVTITSYMVVLMGPLTLPVAIWFWEWPNGHQLVWLISIGVVATFSQLIFTQGVKEAEVAVVMPLQFFRLLWAAIIGYVFFAEVPDAFTWIGGIMIFSSGIYIANRERRIASENRLAADATRVLG